MKRIARSKSGKEIYGPKWQNIMESNTSCETGNDGNILSSPSLKTHKTALLTDDASPPPAVSEADHVADQEASEEIMERKQSFSTCHEPMYRAALHGDCVAAEMLLEQLPNLAIDELNEERDRALHIAAAFKHKKLVKILVQRLSATDLKLLDGNGYTACCYAAISGVVDIADIMIRKNRTLPTARDWENKTPLYKAASRGNAKMLSYFLKNSKVEDMPIEEWFHLLLLSIGRKMYGVALEISRMNEQLATMSNDDEGTALHLLARQRFIEINKVPWLPGIERQDIRLLAKNLWENIHKFGKDSAVKLMKNPPILHNAAEVGNVELITMITQTYPELVWETDSRGYTIFHVAVINRHVDLFELINEIGARMDVIAASQDENGNNILHLAAKLGPLDWRVLPISLFKMQWEMAWFMKVKAVVQPACMEMKNKEGQTARELFSKEHLSLLNESRLWLRNMADSSMLISTLILSVLVASAFAVPGGYNQYNGIPLMYKAKWFPSFIFLDGLAMLFSAWSLSIFFFSVMISSLNEERYAKYVPNVYTCGIMLQIVSAILGTSAFISAYLLVYTETNPVFRKVMFAFAYVGLVSVACLMLVFLVASHPERVIRRRTRHTLFTKTHLFKKTRYLRKDVLCVVENECIEIVIENEC